MKIIHFFLNFEGQKSPRGRIVTGLKLTLIMQIISEANPRKTRTALLQRNSSQIQPGFESCSQVQPTCSTYSMCDFSQLFNLCGPQSQFYHEDNNSMIIRLNEKEHGKCLAAIQLILQKCLQILFLSKAHQKCLQIITLSIALERQATSDLKGEVYQFFSQVFLNQKTSLLQTE